MQDDEEVAKSYAAGIDDLADIDGASSPQLGNWDEWRELAADIQDAINAQTISLVSSQIEKGKPRPKFKPVPRPEPAMQRAIKAREKELEAQMEDSFMGILGGN